MFDGWLGTIASMLILDGFAVVEGFGGGFIRDRWLCVKQGNKFFPPCTLLFPSGQCGFVSNSSIVLLEWVQCANDAVL